MNEATPESVFFAAQDALARGDWEGFFSRLDRNDLLRIASNSMNALLHGAASKSDLAELGTQNGLSGDLVLRLREQRAAITASAETLLARNSSAAADASTRHRQLFRDYEAMLEDGLKAAPDLARLTASLERQMRTTTGGGSVASDLFAGETLHDVSAQGTRAWATRRSGAREEDVGFVQKKGGWYIRLWARRPTSNGS